MQGIILASGRGERFWPLTAYTPKPLLPLVNLPLLEHLLSALSEAGCTEIYVSIGYAADQTYDFLSTIELPSAITPVLAEDWEHGPFASFQAVLPYLSTDEPVILVPTDLYVSPQDLHLLISTSSPMALLFDPQKKQAGSQVTMNRSNQITELTQSQSILPEAFPNLPALRAMPNFLDQPLPEDLNFSFTVFTVLQHWLAEGGQIQGIPTTTLTWADIDTPHDLVRLNHHLLTDGWPPYQHPPGMLVPKGKSLEGPLETANLALGPHSQIHGPVLLGTHIQVGENCLIRDGSTLGNHTVIEANSELAQCITLAHTQVPSNVDLRAAVLDAHGSIVH
ncbi:MAG: NTP transferase domain-containing protein [Promethearchaeota archaeon]